MNSPLLALDIGLKRTGVALSESGMIAHPLKVLVAKPPHLTNVIQDVVELIKEYEIKTLVVGMPFTEEDIPTSQSLKTSQIIKLLEENIQKQVGWTVQIELINEFHSSLDADQIYPGVERDAAAATLILQEYLDQNLI